MSENVQLNETPEQPVIDTVEPTLRKRGRKARVETPPVPESAPSADVDKPTRRRARKPNASAVQQLIGVHKMVSMLPGMEVFAIEEAEATILAEGMQGIADEYGVALSGKTGATLNMIVALGMVYGPRLYLLVQMRKERMKNLPTENVNEVTTLQ